MKFTIQLFTLGFLFSFLLSCKDTLDQTVYFNVEIEKINDTVPCTVDIEFNIARKTVTKTIDQNFEFVGNGYHEGIASLKATKKSNIKNITIQLNWIKKDKTIICNTLESNIKSNIDSNVVFLKQNLW